MERRNKFKWFGLVSTISILIVVVLYTVYDTREKRYGGFSRVIHEVLVDSIVVELPFNSYYLAGASVKTIYLGNETSSLHLMIVHNNQLRPSTIQGLQHVPRASRILVDSPYLYLEDLERYTIYSGTLSTVHIDRPVPGNSFFSEAIPLSPISVVRRRLSDKSAEYILSKRTIAKETFHYDLLEKQIDGLFCTDGMLQYDNVSHRFTYIYFYRNQFSCMDSCLNLLFRGNTIDTISKARIRVANLASEHASTLSSPPFIVNRRSAVFKNQLFINSNLLSDGEEEDILQKYCVIDVYELSQGGQYLFSFYLPHYKGHKMKCFMVRGDKIISLHDRYLVQHTLRLHLNE